MSRSKYRDAAVYDVIREVLSDGNPRTIAEIAEEADYSTNYIRQWIKKIPDAIKCNSRTGDQRVTRYRIEPGEPLTSE